MARVLDASVLLHWLADEALSEQARLLLEADEVLAAPVLARSEVANGLWVQVRAGRMSLDEATERLDALDASDIRFVDDIRIQLGAVRLATGLGHACYDCEYLALAIDLDAELVTADDDLWQSARPLIGERAIWLGDVGRSR